MNKNIQERTELINFLKATIHEVLKLAIWRKKMMVKMANYNNTVSKIIREIHATGTNMIMRSNTNSREELLMALNIQRQMSEDDLA
jgi:CII-binding regulator of phage lambda lysogenization HflD